MFLFFVNLDQILPLHRFSEVQAPPLVCSKYRLESLEVSWYSGVLWLYSFNGVGVLVEVAVEGCRTASVISIDDSIILCTIDRACQVIFQTTASTIQNSVR